jgi:hypothetical protein
LLLNFLVNNSSNMPSKAELEQEAREIGELRDSVWLAQSIVARFYWDPWHYCRVVLGITPDPWQREVMDAVVGHRRVAVRSGHGVGKTNLSACLIHWFIATRSYPQIICTSNTAVQLATRLWREIAVVNSNAANKDMFSWQATTFKLKSAPERWFALAQPWSLDKPEAFQGAHEKNILVLFDEASGIPDVIWDAASGAMTTPGARWVAVGNPTRNTGKFYECFGKNAWHEGDPEDQGLWRGFTVSCLDSKRVPESYISEQKREYGADSDFYRVRVLGLPPVQEVKQFISKALFDAAATRITLTNPLAPRILGVDVAWEGDDRTVAVDRKGSTARLAFTRRGQDTMRTVGDVLAELQRAKDEGEPYDHIVVDTVGIGAGVHDRLREQGINVAGVNVGITSRNPDRYRNMRAELWDLYRQWLATGTVPMELQEDSCGIQYMHDSSGKLVMEKKSDIKKRGLSSPDMADAICLTFYIQGQLKAAVARPAYSKKQSGGTGWRKEVPFTPLNPVY